MIGRFRAYITNVLADIAAHSAVLHRALDRHTTASLADLVRIMNSYYSIPSRDTRRALVTLNELWKATWTRMSTGVIFNWRLPPTSESKGKLTAWQLLEEALRRGEFDRGEVPRITGLPDRTARRVLTELTDVGLLASHSPKGPVSLRFPADTLEQLPRLYPQT